jgi:hypothetical protein
MILSHRIVALVRTEPARVICMTCGSEHNYKKIAPTTQSVSPIKRTADGGITQVSRAGEAAPTKKSKAAAPKTSGTRSNDWETHVLGQAVTAFTRYSMSRTFSLGELVSHPKFGEGYVLEIVDPKKVTIVFRDGQKTLAQDQSAS